MEAHIDFKTRVAQIRARLKAKGAQTFKGLDGSWETGHDGTFIITYIRNSWPEAIIAQVLQKFEEALQVPSSIGKYMASSGGEWDGSNYLSSEGDMRKALTSLGYENISTVAAYNLQFKGLPTTMTLSYFNDIIKDQGGNLWVITDYLMKGMTSFQTLTKLQTKNRQCSQIVITISAVVITPKLAKVFATLNHLVSSYDTSQEVKKVLCGEIKMNKIVANFTSQYYEKYGKKAMEFIVPE